MARTPPSAQTHRSTAPRGGPVPSIRSEEGGRWPVCPSLPASLGFQASCPAARLKIGSSSLCTRRCLRTHSGSRTLPLSSFRDRPRPKGRAHLDALVAGAGRHPPPVEIERDIMDEVLMVRRDAACHKHGFRQARAFSVCPSRLGKGQPRRRADLSPPGPRRLDKHGACGLRAPAPRPSSRHAPGGSGVCACACASETRLGADSRRPGGRPSRCFKESDEYSLLKCGR